MTVRAPERVGPAGLLEAAELLLTRPDLDLVVIRDLVPRRVLRRLAAAGADRHAVLRKALPVWDELTALVTGWWEEHGYRDYRPVLPLLLPGNVRRGSLAAHLDPMEDDGGLYGPLTMSLVTSRTAGTFLAERSDVDLYGPGRTFAADTFAAVQDDPAHPGNTGRSLRTSVDQGRGDAVLITNHPFPTYHGVEASDDREAQIYECLLLPAS